MATTAKAPTQTLNGRTLPPGWTYRSDVPVIDGGRSYSGPADLAVVESIGVEVDARRRQHVSVSRADRLPSWDDLLLVKRLFLGHDATALQVLPPSGKHISYHPYCLHLWVCLDGCVTPDFTRGRRAI